MDEKSGFQKPLRHTLDKEHDLLKTYKKNEGKVIPIYDEESDKPTSDETKQDVVNEPIEAENLSDGGKAEEDFLSGLVDSFFADKAGAIDEIKKERDELKEQLVRKAAEFENQRKRHMKEKQELINFANERLLFRMLETLDDINAAVDAGNKSSDFDALLKGISMIQQKSMKVFDEFGVKLMEDPKGKQFDVHFHEAMMAMNSDEPEGTILQTLQPGYMMHDKVLRHAKVITSNGIANK